MSTFSTPESLSEWLISEVKMKAWRVQPGTKNIHNLWLEVKDGETVLDEAANPIRTVLLEVKEMSDGSLRERNRPLSEKMKTGYQNVEVAALRAVKEELGSVLLENVKIDEIVKIVPRSHSVQVNDHETCSSYTGLPTRYVVNYVEGLPEGDFYTVEDEYAEYGPDMTAKAVTVKRHLWKWTPVPLLLHQL